MFRGKEELENFDIDNNEEFSKKVYEEDIQEEGKEFDIDINQEEESQLKSFGNIDLKNPEVQKLLQEKISKMKEFSKSDIQTNNQQASIEEINETKNLIFKSNNKEKTNIIKKNKNLSKDNRKK